MKAERFGTWIIQKIAVSLSLEGPANIHSPRAQNKATAGTFPEGLLTLTMVWPEQHCPGTLAPLQLLTSACSHETGASPMAQQGFGASLFHARPRHGHPKQLHLVCAILGRIPAAWGNRSAKAAMPKNGLLKDSVSGDRSSSPTKHAFCSFLMSLKVCPLAVWRTW